MRTYFLLPLVFFCGRLAAQGVDSVRTTYKRRVLETAEVDILTSFYSQDGDNAAVSGGRGTEKLTDFTPTIVVTMPLNADDILTVDAGISAYSSASSSNVNPFDGGGEANAFQASSGASSSDTWFNLNGTYTHNSDDRNKVWSGKLSVATEYDYFSVGFGGSYARLFNEKNTEISLKGNIYLDTWSTVYPYELRPFAEGRDGLADPFFSQHTISGKLEYAPQFQEFTDKQRNSYSLGGGFSQILSKKLQASLALDLVQQQGLLSTPFQRVYFADIGDSFIEDFQLADDIERLPDSRFKIALGGRMNYFLNEMFVLRTYYRYYSDNWGIQSNTLNLEIPVKLFDKFTVYPSYRYYNQTAADYFAGYEAHLSTEEFYTSDYDLSEFNANQYGLGIRYTDIFTSVKVWGMGLKNVDLKYMYYQRNSGLRANMISGGLKFIVE